MPYVNIKLPTTKTRIIAFRDNEKDEIIATGYDFDIVRKSAIDKGCKSPFLMSVSTERDCIRTH